MPLSIKAAFAQNPAFKDSKIGQVMRSLRADGLDGNVEHPRAFKSQGVKGVPKERDSTGSSACSGDSTGSRARQMQWEYQWLLVESPPER